MTDYQVCSLFEFLRFHLFPDNDKHFLGIRDENA